jgi:hypothetical protein
VGGAVTGGLGATVVGGAIVAGGAEVVDGGGAGAAVGRIDAVVCVRRGVENVPETATPMAITSRPATASLGNPMTRRLSEPIS